MALKNLVVHEDRVAEKIVVESHEFIELPQLEAEVASNQQVFDATIVELVAAPADPEVLVEIATRRDEAQRSLEDSKSNVERYNEVVAGIVNTTPENEAENGAGSETENPVEVPVTVL